MAQHRLIVTVNTLTSATPEQTAEGMRKLLHRSGWMANVRVVHESVPEEPPDFGALGQYEKTILYAVGGLVELVAKGLVAAGPGAPELTPEGLAAYRRLTETGWKPSPEELTAAVMYLKSDSPK